MSHRFTSLSTHIVFSTKERKPLINGEISREIFPYLAGILQGQRCIPVKISGTANHVHILVVHPPTLCISDIVRLLKSNSSKWVHEKWPQHPAFAWQTGYGAFSVSKSNRNAVIQYIDNQEAHHRRYSFEEEFLALLRKHGIEYDPKQVWE